MLIYAITSRMLLADSEPKRAEKLVSLAAKWVAGGVDFVQIRETDLTGAELVRLASRIVQAVRHASRRPRVLINGAADRAVPIALHSGCDGIHFPGGMDPGELAAAVAQIRKNWRFGRDSGSSPLISVSCHSAAEVVSARAAGATLALFAPVFEKALPGAPALVGQGLESLAEACRAARQPGSLPEIPVLALGGVTLENAPQCIAAGAAGIAAIRLFLDSEGQEPHWQRLSKLAE
jgi:thiamine-phosphate pyrophosphorylase